MSARVVVTHQPPPGGFDALDALPGVVVITPPGGRPATTSDLAGAVAGADALLCTVTDRVGADVLEAGHGTLRIVSNVGVGYDNIDVVAAGRLGITVCNTPGVLDDSTADLAFLLVLAASRLASDAERRLREGRWTGWTVTGNLGRDVHGAVLGIVGYGRIGRAVARRATGFGMSVLHHSRHDSGEPGYVADLDDLLRRADAVTLHVPGGDATRHLIDARRLALMKPTAVLVNTARGPVVDEAALATALHEGRLFAAGLDVYEREPAVLPELLAAPRTVLLPHIGSATLATRTRMARMAAEAVVTALSGGTPPNRVTA